MHARNEDIHRLLDGGLSAGERERVRREIEAEPVLADELHQLEEVSRLLDGGKDLSPGEGFTASVMARLPDRPTTLARRVRAFLFGERLLRWNMATAALAIVLLLVALAAVRMGGERDLLRKAGQPGNVVTFRLYAPQAARVALAGEFNRWQPGATLLRPERDGFWSTEVRLAPGTYAYMFVLDGTRWVTDPVAELHRDDGFGYRNAVVRVNHL